MLLRRAIPADALAVAQVHVRSWQVGYRGLLPDGYLDTLSSADRAARYTFDAQDGPRTTVAIDGDSIVGFATTRGRELAALYVAPESWCRGIGGVLIARAREDFVAAGVTSAELWLLVGNTRGQRFYERDGRVREGEPRAELVWGLHVEQVRYRRGLP